MEAVARDLPRLLLEAQESASSSTKVESVLAETWQIATTATLARLEQRADDQRDRLSKIEAMLVEHRDRIRALEDGQTGERAVRKFSKAGFGMVVLVISAASGFAARYLH